MTNAGIMKEGLEASGLKVYGGVNAPYLWVKPRMAFLHGGSLSRCCMRPT